MSEIGMKILWIMQFTPKSFLYKNHTAREKKINTRDETLSKWELLTERFDAFLL